MKDLHTTRQELKSIKTIKQTKQFHHTKNKTQNQYLRKLSISHIATLSLNGSIFVRLKRQKSTMTQLPINHQSRSDKKRCAQRPLYSCS
jgi:hypothetical protein